MLKSKKDLLHPLGQKQTMKFPILLLLMFM